MTNDDPMYVMQLESALEAAELEIKRLEDELRKQWMTLQQLLDQLNPTHMGEPLITDRTQLMQHDAAIYERCAETAFNELDDPYLSGHGYATRVSYAIRQLAAEKEKE